MTPSPPSSSARCSCSRLQVSSNGDSRSESRYGCAAGAVEAPVGATGERGLAEALDPLFPELWGLRREAF